MQLFPLPTDGRITVAATTPVPPGLLRVALRVDAGDVVVDALGPNGPRHVGRFGAADATAYRPVLARLAAQGHLGSCPARMVHADGAPALLLHLGSPASCAARGRREPHDVDPRPQHPPATVRTARLRAASPAARATRPHRPCPSRTGTAPPPRSAVTPGRDHGGPASAGRPSLPARPPARFGQPDDAAPRLTRDQRRSVMWVTVGIAAALLLASGLQHATSAGPPTGGAVACAEGDSTCR